MGMFREEAKEMRRIREDLEAAARAHDQLADASARMAVTATPQGGQMPSRPGGLHTGTSGTIVRRPEGTYSNGTVLDSTGQPAAGGHTVRIGGSGGGGGFGGTYGDAPTEPGTYLNERRGDWVWMYSPVTRILQWVHVASVSNSSSGGGGGGGGGGGQNDARSLVRSLSRTPTFLGATDGDPGKSGRNIDPSQTVTRGDAETIREIRGLRGDVQTMTHALTTAPSNGTRRRASR